MHYIISMSQIVTFTKEAEAHIDRLMNMKQAEDAIGISLSVPSKGCSGLSYKMDFMPKEKEGAAGFEPVNLGNGHIVYVDMKATMYLLGTEIDYDSSDKLAPGFKFRNPMAVGECGCGESFTIDGNK